MFTPAKQKNREKVKVPLTSLIDIVFLLLLYFLLTTNFMVDEGIKVKLPQAKASATHTHREITVTVDKDGKIFLGDRETGTANLFDDIRRLLAEAQDAMVVVKADHSLAVNIVVKVMDICKAAGAERLCLATEREF